MHKTEHRVEFFTEEPLNKVEVDQETGHYEMLTPKGKHILTLIHPTEYFNNGIEEEELNRFKGDLRLHQHASSVFDSLKEIHDNLSDLQTDAISIFDFPIDKLIRESAIVLKRASRIE